MTIFPMSQQTLQSILGAVVAQTFDAVLMMDAQQQLVYFDEGAQRLFGYTAAEALGQPLDMLLPEALRGSHLAQARSFLRAEDVARPLGRQARLVQGRHKSGRLVDLDATVAKIRQEDGAWALVAFLRDVTEHQRHEAGMRQAQAQLQNQVDESEARYRQLFEQSPDAIVVHQHGRVLFANPAAQRLVGAATPEAMIGRPALDFVPPEHQALVLARIAEALRTGAPLPTQEEILLRLDGERIEVEVAGAVVQVNGQPAIQLVGRDISERKRRERELQALADLSAALRQATSRAEMAHITTVQVKNLLAASAARLTLTAPDISEGFLEVSEGHFGPASLTLERCQHCPLRLRWRNVTVHAADWRMLNPDITCACLEPLRAVLAVPLTSQEAWQGMLFVGRETVRPFSQTDQHLLATLADMAAAALRRAGLLELTERRLQRLTAMHAIDAAINTSDNWRATLHVLLEHVVYQLGVDAASVLLNRDEPVLLRYAAGVGFRTRLIERTVLRMGEGVAGQAALTRAPQFAADPPNWQKRHNLRALEGFVAHGAVPLLARNRVIGVLEIFKRSALRPDAEWQDYLAALAGQVALALEKAQLIDNLQASHKQLEQAYEATIEGWSVALELRDEETQGHTRRVTEMTVRLAQAMNLPPADIVQIRRGALLHDIGKMVVPDAVLFKPGPLDAEEEALMRLHPTYAWQMLSGIDYLRPALDIPLYHHERWDGSGYPKGLRGADIPLAARLFAVVDVWDALSSDRPYRRAWPSEQVKAYLQANAGVLFDPAVVAVFVAMLDEVTKVLNASPSKSE